MAMKTVERLDDAISGLVKQQKRIKSKAAHRLISKRMRRRVKYAQLIPPRKPSRVVTYRSGFMPGVDRLKLKEIMHDEDVENYLRMRGR